MSGLRVASKSFMLGLFAVPKMLEVLTEINLV